MRITRTALTFVFAALGGVGVANATAIIHIDLGSQTMHVSSSTGSYSWPVSTARFGYRTPHGSFAPTSLQRMHYSAKYHWSPMPYSIFFAGGYAIHGTYETGALGRPASHGCVRLSPGHAAQLYSMVQSEGGRISISGSPPGPTRYAAIRHHYRQGGYGQDRSLAYAERHHHFRGSVRSWQRSFPRGGNEAPSFFGLF